MSPLYIVACMVCMIFSELSIVRVRIGTQTGKNERWLYVLVICSG